MSSHEYQTEQVHHYWMLGGGTGPLKPASGNSLLGLGKERCVGVGMVAGRALGTWRPIRVQAVQQQGQEALQWPLLDLHALIEHGRTMPGTLKEPVRAMQAAAPRRPCGGQSLCLKGKELTRSDNDLGLNMV